MSMVLHGQPIFPGIVTAPVYVYIPGEAAPYPHSLTAGEVDGAFRRLDAAQQAAAEELLDMQSRMSQQNADQGLIFEAHREILFDESIAELLSEKIREELCTPEFAVEQSFDFYAEHLKKAKDERIRERCADVWDVKRLLLRKLGAGAGRSLTAIPRPCVLAAKELLPSDTVSLDRSKVLAILTEDGNRTSHAAILANTLSIPSIVGVAGLMENARNGDEVSVNAGDGEVVLSPTVEQKREYERLLAQFEDSRRQTERFLRQKGTMSDGTPVSIGLNIGSPKDVGGQSDFYDYVGLFRTEFLFMGSDHMPTESEQFEAYAEVLKGAGKPVTLRTLDIGGDKELPYWPRTPEQNPNLGVRALRLCFANEDVFRRQLRAALRASVFGELSIMVPMAASLEDIRRARGIFESVRQALLTEGVPFSPNVRFGAMIEVPALAMLARPLADEVDFASIGTNDLCQYLMAADRGNPGVAEYYQMFHPAFLGLLRHVLGAFRDAGKPVSICGEMAGEVKAALLLVGLGARKLSMSAGRIASVKQALNAHSLDELTRLADEALRRGTNREVCGLLDQL